MPIKSYGDGINTVYCCRHSYSNSSVQHHYLLKRVNRKSAKTNKGWCEIDSSSSSQDLSQRSLVIPGEVTENECDDVLNVGLTKANLLVSMGSLPVVLASSPSVVVAVAQILGMVCQAISSRRA